MMWANFGYHNFEITLNGETITLKEAIPNILNSQFWRNFSDEFGEAYGRFKTEDWQEQWDHLKTSMDVTGEKHAREVLGLGEERLTPDLLKKTRKKLMMKWHPDKHPAERKEE